MKEVRKMDKKVELYHGSGQIVEFPEVRKTRYTKDFSWGFYCTKSYEQAYRWAERKHKHGIINVYSYTENKQLKIKKFDQMCDEWLDFIAEFSLILSISTFLISVSKTIVIFYINIFFSINFLIFCNSSHLCW